MSQRMRRARAARGGGKRCRLGGRQARARRKRTLVIRAARRERRRRRTSNVERRSSSALKVEVSHGERHAQIGGEMHRFFARKKTLAQNDTSLNGCIRLIGRISPE